MAHRVSRIGSGRDHYHLFLSKTTGANGAIADAGFDERQDAARRAQLVVDEYVRMGYVAHERQNRSVMELSKDHIRRYVFVRPCNLRHARQHGLAVE